jgi:uncharacterized membrane protein
MQVQVPQGLKAGDTFVVNETIVEVPEGVEDGAHIEVLSRNEHSPDKTCSTAAGAAVAGAIVGTIVMGPLVGVALAGGAAYAT